MSEDKKIKFPEITVIIAMTENGLVGDGDKLPWKSSLDFEWFKKNTMGWPMVFGRKTADGMPIFPLKNRPCAVVTNSSETCITMPIEKKGAYLSFGPGPFYDSLGEAIRFFKNFDNIFIGGGISVYQRALISGQPWIELTGTPQKDNPMVDIIIKTIFPDGCVNGNKYLDKKTLNLMSEPQFNLVYSQEYELNSDKDHMFTTNAFTHPFAELKLSIPKMPMGHDLKKNDTIFPWIRFEIWKRASENQGK